MSQMSAQKVRGHSSSTRTLRWTHTSVSSSLFLETHLLETHFLEEKNTEYFFFYFNGIRGPEVRGIFRKMLVMIQWAIVV